MNRGVPEKPIRLASAVDFAMWFITNSLSISFFKLAISIFKFLKKTVKGFLGSESIKWNFSKFLVDQSGNVIKRYGSMDAPESIEADITKLLAKS